ncbi:GntR family transcriptional regulator [Lacticaseibacillus rhamnosus]
MISRLRHEIVSNKLKPGTIIKDAEVAAHLGTSITPVREALSRLAAEGLVDMPHNRFQRRIRVVAGGGRNKYWPILGRADQPSANRILAHIIPFLRVTFRVPN